MLHQPPVMTSVEELTLVVVSREETSQSEPYRGHPPENDACHVFAQDQTESAFLFDLRLRECLSNPTLLRSLARAVLVCTPDLTDREILRRLRLVAARVMPGGSATLSFNKPFPGDQTFSTRLTRLAQFASTALVAHHVKVVALAMSDLVEESAPLSAAWRRLQLRRAASVAPAPGATAESAPSTRSVVTQTVVHQRKTQIARAPWTPSSEVTPMPFPAPILP